MVAGTTSGKKPVVERLLVARAFPHEVAELQLLETHISWVILTGSFAYKIKKPVKFDFVDYSTLEQRRNFCEKELELNRRFAPELYLDVVPVWDSGGFLRVGNGPDDNGKQSSGIVEWAVKMREFPQDMIVAACITGDELSGEMIDRFGTDIARFHSSIESPDLETKIVRVEDIKNDALDNFPPLLEAFANDDRKPMVERLHRWTVDEIEQVESVLEHRLSTDRVRRCHGDLHLKNVIQWQGRLVPFDGIEFNERLQWIDVVSEIAFPVMDFVARGRPDLGWRLLNAYLEASGDYFGVEVLRYYLIYRAMVRAKVTWLNPKNHAQPNETGNPRNEVENARLSDPWDKYLTAARYFAFDLRPKLAITHGFSGSGKSTAAMQMVEGEGMIRIRSDVERHRLAESSEGFGKYTAETTDRVYGRLLKLAHSILKSGFPVVVDATFLKQSHRRQFEQLAREMAVTFQIVHCDADREQLCRRIRSRGADVSEATVDVLKRQMDTHDPLTAEEMSCVRAAEPQRAEPQRRRGK